MGIPNPVAVTSCEPLIGCTHCAKPPPLTLLPLHNITIEPLPVHILCLSPSAVPASPFPICPAPPPPNRHSKSRKAVAHAETLLVYVFRNHDEHDPSWQTKVV